MTDQAWQNQNCLNCNAPLEGEFCHHCGQHHRVYIRSIFAVLGDLMGEIGHWDSRFYRTLRGLFLKPGFLTLEFMRGRHASYVPPLRLYFFISLFAFIVFSSFIEIGFTPETMKAADPNNQIQIEEMQVDFPFLDVEQQNALKERIKYLTANPDIFAQRLTQLAPQMMLLMLPFWALFLKLLYIYRSHYYLEHLTLALHTHAFILLSLLGITLVTELFDYLAVISSIAWLGDLGSWFDTGLFLWIFVYLLLTQKNFYQQSWPVTILNFILCVFAYLMLLLTAFVGTILYSLLTA
ncbi:DUF3667 domain-containing protein [Pseudidiomarina sp.]|uniref:DUF3667 domain-containing protein n=1 Tax=Pseudidiomarina sp. TaxID=2081707 RepID=UPI003A981B74